MAHAARKVCLIGSGNWGSAIAKIIGNNVKSSSTFDHVINMYVYEEMINGRPLTEIINTEHENVKYLPGIKLPQNIVAVPSIKEAIRNANVFVFVIPHQFVVPVCNQMKEGLPNDAVAISLIKGLSQVSTGLERMSDVIEKTLGVPCSALMGANLAGEVAAEKFCETTVGCLDRSQWGMWKELFHNEYFKVKCVSDVHTVELCGALKNVVAVAAGFTDALQCGDNTKAAVIRLGLMEMREFVRTFFTGVDDQTFLESCGLADLVTTCYGGRNRRVAEAFALTGKSLEELENEMLNGQKLQGPHTAQLAYELIKEKQALDKFPLFTSIYRICYQGEPPQHIIDTLKSYF